MPSRQISPNSFDEILSDLGQDPAIPDPHGIRKPSSPKKPPWEDVSNTQAAPRSTPNPSISKHLTTMGEFKKFGVLLAFVAFMIVAGVVLFLIHGSMMDSQELALQGPKEQISQLKSELALLKEEMVEIEDSLYESIDSLEVSIHLLVNNKVENSPKPQAPRLPFEEEVRHWRYLGSSHIGHSQRAFFHNGKASVMLELGASLLGDWRLSDANKDRATITHPKGKSLVLKASKKE
jgi:hypothetical protein